MEITFVTNFSIAIQVGKFEQIRQLLLCYGLVNDFHGALQFVQRNVSVSVLVKDPTRIIQLILTEGI